MKKRLLAITVLFGASLLGACGDADEREKATCFVDQNGPTRTIVCDNGVNIDVSDGAPCMAIDNGDGTFGNTCSDGSSNWAGGVHAVGCTVSTNMDMDVVLQCGDDPAVTIPDGDNCSVSEVDGLVTIDCENGNTATLSDGESCTLVDNGDNTTTIDCGGDEVVFNSPTPSTILGRAQLFGQVDHSGITVLLVDAEGNELTTTTDADGNYAFEDLDSGRFDLFFSYEGFGDARIIAFAALPGENVAPDVVLRAFSRGIPQEARVIAVSDDENWVAYLTNTRRISLSPPRSRGVIIGDPRLDEREVLVRNESNKRVDESRMFRGFLYRGDLVVFDRSTHLAYEVASEVDDMGAGFSGDSSRMWFVSGVPTFDFAQEGLGTEPIGLLSVADLVAGSAPVVEEVSDDALFPSTMPWLTIFSFGEEFELWQLLVNFCQPDASVQSQLDDTSHYSMHLTACVQFSADSEGLVFFGINEGLTVSALAGDGMVRNYGGTAAGTVRLSDTGHAMAFLSGLGFIGNTKGDPLSLELVDLATGAAINLVDGIDEAFLGFQFLGDGGSLAYASLDLTEQSLGADLYEVIIDDDPARALLISDMWPQADPETDYIYPMLGLMDAFVASPDGRFIAVHQYRMYVDGDFFERQDDIVLVDRNAAAASRVVTLATDVNTSDWVIDGGFSNNSESLILDMQECRNEGGVCGEVWLYDVTTFPEVTHVELEPEWSEGSGTHSISMQSPFAYRFAPNDSYMLVRDGSGNAYRFNRSDFGDDGVGTGSYLRYSNGTGTSTVSISGIEGPHVLDVRFASDSGAFFLARSPYPSSWVALREWWAQTSSETYLFEGEQLGERMGYFPLGTTRVRFNPGHDGLLFSDLGLPYELLDEFSALLLIDVPIGGELSYIDYSGAELTYQSLATASGYSRFTGDGGLLIREDHNVEQTGPFTVASAEHDLLHFDPTTERLELLDQFLNPFTRLVWAGDLTAYGVVGPVQELHLLNND